MDPQRENVELGDMQLLIKDQKMNMQKDNKNKNDDKVKKKFYLNKDEIETKTKIVPGNNINNQMTN